MTTNICPVTTAVLSLPAGGRRQTEPKAQHTTAGGCTRPNSQVNERALFCSARRREPQRRRRLQAAHTAELERLFPEIIQLRPPDLRHKSARQHSPRQSARLTKKNVDGASPGRLLVEDLLAFLLSMIFSDLRCGEYSGKERSMAMSS